MIEERRITTILSKEDQGEMSLSEWRSFTESTACSGGLSLIAYIIVGSEPLHSFHLDTTEFLNKCTLTAES